MSINWHHIDELQENWLLLRLGEADLSRSNRITFWELSVGNADAAVQTTAAMIPVTCDDEMGPVEELFSTLGQYSWVEYVNKTVDFDEYNTIAPIEREALSREEIRRLFDEIESHLDRLILVEAIETGSRNSDIRCLRVKDVLDRG
jgi:integrase